MTEIAPIERNIEYSMQLLQSEPADRNPALVYLQSLAFSGQRTQRVALDKATHILSSGTLDHRTFPFAQLRYQHLATLKTRLQDEGLQFTYVNKILAAVRGVCEQCWNLELRDGNGQVIMSDADLMRIRSVKNLKGSSLLAGRQLSTSELRAIGEACQDGTLRGIRDAALYALLAAAGLRRSEPVSIDISDYNAQDGTVAIRGGKGNKDRIAWIVDDNKRHIDKWLEFRPAVSGPLLFPMRRGGVIELRAMTEQNVYASLQFRAEIAGVECSAHDLRRTFATSALEQGGNIAAVQSQLGHATASQTLRYDRSGENAKRKLAHSMTLSLGGFE